MQHSAEVFIPDSLLDSPLALLETPNSLLSYSDRSVTVTLSEHRTRKRHRTDLSAPSPKKTALKSSNEPQSPPSPIRSPVLSENGTKLRVNINTWPSSQKYQLEKIPEFISNFDTLPPSLKSYMLVQMLKRSPFNTLQLVSSILLPCLRSDFVDRLPVELSHQIFQYLDVSTLARCQTVNRLWKSVLCGLSADLTIWKTRILTEGFATEQELTRVVPDYRISGGSDVVNMDISPIKGLVNFTTYKKFYQKSFKIRKNWLLGRYKRTSFPGHGLNVVTCLQFDTEKIVSGSDDHTIHIYSTEHGEIEKRLIGHEGGVWALQYSGNVLVSGSTDRTVRIWDMRSGLCTHVFDGHTSTVRCLLILNPTLLADGTLAPAQPLIITGSRDTTLRVWRVPDLSTTWSPSDAQRINSTIDPVAAERARNPFFMHLLTGHTNSVRAIAGDGNTLISGSYDCTVRSWDLVTGQNVFTFRGHREKVYSVGYCAELDRAVSGSMDATVRIWCTKTGAALFNLEGHTSLVGLLELSPTLLVSAAADATLRIWCPQTGKCLANLVGHTAAITCFHHDPTLNRIVSGSDGGVKIWELDSVGYGTNRLVSTSVIPRASPLANKLAYAQTPYGPQPIYGRFIQDVLDSVHGVWRVRMDESKLVCACQREQGGTWFEVLDFSESPEIGTHSTMPGDRDLRGGDDLMEGEEEEVDE